MDGFTKRAMIAVGVGLVTVFGFGPWPAIVAFFAVLLLTPDLDGGGAHPEAEPVSKRIAARAASAAAPKAAAPETTAAAPKKAAAPRKTAKKAPPAGPKLKAAPESAAAGAAPMLLTEPVGKADDLKLLKGVGPKLESVLNEMGFYHFDQIAAWTPDQVNWVDETMEGVNRGRASRDGWVEQAKVLATGALTEFAKRVEAGEVPTSEG
jgi:NADH-quinone oxidoreductase subunit E